MNNQYSMFINIENEENVIVIFAIASWKLILTAFDSFINNLPNRCHIERGIEPIQRNVSCKYLPSKMES